MTLNPSSEIDSLLHPTQEYIDLNPNPLFLWSVHALSLAAVPGGPLVLYLFCCMLDENWAIVRVFR